jgi:hypothetical protein
MGLIEGTDFGNRQQRRIVFKTFSCAEYYIWGNSTGADSDVRLQLILVRRFQEVGVDEYERCEIMLS